MIRIVYTISPEQKKDEEAWLKSQKIYAYFNDHYDWRTNKMLLKVGMIISPEAATIIKLSRKLDNLEEYIQK